MFNCFTYMLVSSFRKPCSILQRDKDIKGVSASTLVIVMATVIMADS